MDWNTRTKTERKMSPLWANPFGLPRQLYSCKEDLTLEESMELPTAWNLPWAKTAVLGAGVSAPSGELTKTATTPFDALPGDSRSERTRFIEIRNETELRDFVSTDLSAGMNTANMAGSVRTHVENSVRFDERSSTIMFSGIYEWDPAISSTLPQMTAEAKNLYQKDPTEFHRAYGHYFIGGFTKTAKITIFARMMAVSQESLSKVSAEVGANIHSVGWEADINAATELEKLIKNENCQIEIDIYKDGMVAGGDTEVFGQSLASIPKHVKDFQKRAIGTKNEALLIHYARVEPKVIPKIPVSPTMYQTAKHLYEDIVVANTLSNSLPKQYTEEYRGLLRHIEDDVAADVPRDLSGDINTLFGIADRMDNWISDVKTLRSYQKLWRIVNKTPGTKRGSRWGYTDLDDPELSNLDIDVTSQSRRKEWKNGWVTGSLKVDVGDRKICGVVLVSNKGNNGKHVLSKGGLHQSFVEFKLDSDFDRGFNWTAKVLSAPEEMSRFVSDDL